MRDHRHGSGSRRHYLSDPPPNAVANKRDEQYDRDRTRDNNDDGLGAFGGKAESQSSLAG
jgi:hypothetical protein